MAEDQVPDTAPQSDKPVLQAFVFIQGLGFAALDTNGYLWRRRQKRKGPNGEAIWLRGYALLSSSDIFTTDPDFGTE